MGGKCDPDNKTHNNPKIESNKNIIYDDETINKNFNKYIFQDDFIDFVDNKYKLNDPIFKVFHRNEREILEKFYKSKKNKYQNNMEIYLKKQNLNFVNSLTKQIILNEDGRKILKGKIKNEILK